MAGFLHLVGVTIQSYLSTYDDDSTDNYDEKSEEVQFVLSLCGTVTSKQREKERLTLPYLHTA